MLKITGFGLFSFFTKMYYNAILPQTVLAAMAGTNPDELKPKNKINYKEL